MALPVRSRRPHHLARDLQRWDPFFEMEGLYERFSDLMQTIGGDPMLVSPTADIEETDDAFVVELDLPGVKSDDLDVEVSESQLRVHGEIKERKRTGILRRQNRAVGKFDYLLSLPGEVDPEKVEASLSDGVLTVELAKAASSHPRRIEVKG